MPAKQRRRRRSLFRDEETSCQNLASRTYALLEDWHRNGRVERKAQDAELGFLVGRLASKLPVNSRRRRRIRQRYRRARALVRDAFLVGLSMMKHLH